MISIPRTLARLVTGAALGLSVAAVPAPAAAAIPLAPAAQCVIPPGVYGIVDSSGTVVGLLIVYPDCRMEVYTKRA